MRHFSSALFHAAWAEDRDVGADPEIQACANAAGLDGGAVIAAIDAQETKDGLRAATEEAVQRGAFGAPTFFLGDAMFWGNDRLGLIERALAHGA